MATVLPAYGQTVAICDDDTEFPPYSYYDRTVDNVDSPQLTGATVELLQAIFEHINIEYQYSLIPWKRCLQEVAEFDRRQRFEIFVNGSYSKKRAELYFISNAIYSTHEGLWYSTLRFPSAPPIVEAEDLNNYHNICGQLGANYDWLPDLGVTVPLDLGSKSVAAALQKVERGRCDFYIGGLENTYGGEVSGQYRIPQHVVDIPFPSGREPSFHIFIAKTSPRAFELYTHINQAILMLQYNGVSKQIFDKYIPSDAP